MTSLLAPSACGPIEIRQKPSNLVTGVVNLQPNWTSDIDYLQGRLPAFPAALGDATTPVSAHQRLAVTGFPGLSLLVTPGFEQAGPRAVGGQGHYWLDDHVRSASRPIQRGGSASTAILAPQT